MNFNTIKTLCFFFLLFSGPVFAQMEGEDLLLEETLNQQEVVESVEEEVQQDQGLAIITETTVFEIQYVTVEKLIEKIREILTKDIGQVSLEGGSNNIQVTDVPEKMVIISNLIQAMDKDEREIIINTKVLQVALNDEHMTGIDWEAIVSDYQKISVEEKKEKDIRDVFVNTLSFGTVSQEDVEVLLEALDTVGEIRIILESKISTKNQYLTNVTIDSILSHFTDAQEESSDGFSVIDIHLNPKITDEKNIDMTVRPRLNEALSSLEAEIKVSVGSTIVVGGIFKEVLVDYTRKIPLLGDIPFLGFAFRNQGERQRPSEIIIFFTPKIKK